MRLLMDLRSVDRRLMKGDNSAEHAGQGCDCLHAHSHLSTYSFRFEKGRYRDLESCLNTEYGSVLRENGSV